MSLHYKMYQSRAAFPQSPDVCDDILNACHRNNPKSGLTGFLYAEGNWFVQYLEGPRDALEETMSRIHADPRHDDIQFISDSPLDNRMFPDWQMGFVNANQVALRDVFSSDGSRLNLTVQDPFDLVVFLSMNADLIREKAAV